MPPIIVTLITKLLAYTDGYKTIFSAIGFVGYAIYLLCSGTTPDVNGAIQAFLTGLGLLGLGHKLAKNTAAQNVVDGPVTPQMLTKEPFANGTTAPVVAASSVPPVVPPPV